MYATEEIPHPNDPVLAPTEPDELVSAQLHDHLCLEICRLLNGGVFAIKIDDDGILVRTAEAGPQIVIPDTFKQRDSNHYPKFDGHPGGRKLYYRLFQHY